MFQLTTRCVFVLPLDLGALDVPCLRRPPLDRKFEFCWNGTGYRARLLILGKQSRKAMEGSMLDGVILLWFLLTAAALLFVAVDIRTTPESPVLK
jgi:hypothetical protein